MLPVLCLFLCVTDAHTWGPTVQWVLQCQLTEHLWDPRSVINVSFLCAQPLQWLPNVFSLASVNYLSASLWMCFISFCIFPPLWLCCLLHISWENTLLLLCNVIFLPLWFAVVLCSNLHLCIVSLISYHTLSFRATGWMSRGVPSLLHSRYDHRHSWGGHGLSYLARLITLLRISAAKFCKNPVLLSDLTVKFTPWEGDFFVKRNRRVWQDCNVITAA